jgi:hypothetical protein
VIVAEIYCTYCKEIEKRKLPVRSRHGLRWHPSPEFSRPVWRDGSPDLPHLSILVDGAFVPDATSFSFGKDSF